MTVLEHTPPFLEAERIVAHGEAANMPEHRRFLVRDCGSNGNTATPYWQNRANGYRTRNDADALWTPSGIAHYLASGNHVAIELLPEQPVGTVEKLITVDELDNTPLVRICRLEKLDGTPIGPTLKGSADGKTYGYWSVHELYEMKERLKNKEGKDKFKVCLMARPDALVGGPELEKLVTLEELKALEGTKPPRKVLVRSVNASEDGYYYVDSATGQNTARSRATQFNVEEAAKFETGQLFELLKAKKLSEFNKLFHSSLINLIKACPNNEVVRGVLLARLRVAVPAECDTYDKIVEWVEWNCDGKVPDINGRPMRPVPVGLRAQPTGPRFEMVIVQSRRDLGRCSYSVSESGVSRGRFSAEDIDDIIQDATSINEALGMLRDHIAENEDCDYEADDEYSYEDYETQDTDNHETEIDQPTDTKQLFIQWLQTHMPERADELGVPAPARAETV
jgi:hypothetical protein